MPPAEAHGERIGSVTSAIWSPRLEKNIGYAMVPMAYASVGATFQIDSDDEVGERTATVVPKPFVDPKKEIPKAV